MCLGPEFFDGRDALVLEREAAGDIELENFLKPRHVSIDRLYHWGLLKDEREFLSTADFFVHQVTERGRDFMEEAEYQLIFIRRDQANAFNTFIYDAWRRKQTTRLHSLNHSTTQAPDVV